MIPPIWIVGVAIVVGVPKLRGLLLINIVYLPSLVV